MFEKIKSTYEAIFTKFKKIFTVKKSSLLDNLESEVNTLNDDVVPTIQSIITSVTDGRIDGKVLENNPILKSIRGFLKHDVKSNLKLLEVITTVANSIKDSENKLDTLVNKTMANTTTDKTATLRELGVLKLLNDIVLFRSYSMDLAYMIAADYNPDVTLHKEAIERLKNNAGNFAESIDQLNAKAIDDVIKKIPDMAGVAVVDIIAATVDGVGNVISSTADIFGIFGSGFIGNPIYHFRVWLEDIKYKKNEDNKAKKQIIELILIDLRKKASGEYDKELAKQIQYYENKIYSIEHEIARYESCK